MAKKIFNRRAIATLLTLVMLLNVFPIGAVTAATTPDLVKNYADTYYKQDGSAGSASDWEIHLSKTAAPTGEDNIFDITLTVETKDTSIQTAGATNGAVVLVLDVSNSMNTKETVCAVAGCDQDKNADVHCTRYDGKYFWRDECEDCGQTKAAHDAHHKYQQSNKTQLQSLQAAVSSFLDAFVKDAAAGEKRMVAVAVFGTDASTIQGWVDVTNATNLSNLKAKINSLSTGNGAYMGKNYLFNGGTNMEAGLVLGRNLLKNTTALAGIPVANQSLILFSDGEPTACVGNVNSASTEKVTHGGNDEGTKTDKVDYDDISNILKDVSAAKIAVKYNYNDDSGVLKTPPFTRVITSGASSLAVDLQGEAGKVITNKTKVHSVTDPMGTGVSMLTVTTGYNATTEKWDLSQYTPTVADGITTYTITYQVELDPMTVALDPNYPGYTVLTPANGATTLDYTYGEDATAVNADFNEPSIRGVRTFTVSYAYSGEVPAGAPVVPAPKTYKAGASVQVADAPTLENYTFSGWDKTDFVMPAENVVIIGSWSENAKHDYSLTYNANFGANQTLADAENISGTYATAYNIGVDANTFVRPNYTFAGWNTERDGSGKAYAVGEAVALTSDNNTEVLYAQWIEHNKYAYSLVYDANFGANETKADDENISGTYATSHNIEVDANTFVRPNYTFAGWNTERDGSGKAYAAGNIVALTAADNTEILYAQWTQNTKYDYNLIYDANFGANVTVADDENISGIYATAYSIKVDVNMFSRANYTFAGWNTERDGSGKAYAAGNTVALTAKNNTEILYAQWIEYGKYDYSLIYNANFGANQTLADAENISGTYATAYNIGVDVNTFVRENYTFAGWNTEANGSGKAYAAGQTVALTSDNNTEILYAQWIEHNKYAYSLVYNANFGQNETKADAENISGTYATSHNIEVDANTFIRENYTFAGWNTEADGSGKAYAAGDIVALTSDNNTEILYAQWTQNPKFDYSLIYNANFGIQETKADAENISGIYATYHSITVDANTFVRPNYTFAGWNTEADGSGKVYSADDVITLTTKNNTEVLYAQWTQNPKYDYSLIYNANFGANETKADEENITGTYATVYGIKVDANTFVRENYTFAGWNTASDGSGKAYAAGNLVVLNVKNNTEVLYAQWIEHAKYDYSVIYNANFGENETKADAENITGTYATEYNIGVDANTFVRENYTFIGWATEPNGSVVYNPGDNIHFVKGGAEVLYAQWVEHNKYSYTVIYNGNGGALTGGELAYGDSQNVASTYATTHNIDVDANAFIRENHTFAGWNTEADGSGKAYAAGDVIALTASSNTETLYAQWIEHAKYDYSVIYNANFGENETKADAENITGTYATEYNITVDANTFVREHYTFVSWNTEANGTGKTYTAEDVIALTAADNTETLYAQWQINEYDYTVNYWVRVNSDEYALFSGELNGAPVGEKVAYGTVIDQAYLEAKGLPATLTDAAYTYSFTAFEGVTVTETENVVNVYFTCIVEEKVEEPEDITPPAGEGEEEVEIPEEDVPLAEPPKTSDNILVYFYSAAASVTGLACLLLGKKKEEIQE